MTINITANGLQPYAVGAFNHCINLKEKIMSTQKTVKKASNPPLRKGVVMPRFNLNHKVIIYPNEKGFAKIKALIANRYLLSNEEAENWVNKRKTEDGGYKEQLWVIVSDLHDMFYNGQSYMATTWIALLNEA